MERAGPIAATIFKKRQLVRERGKARVIRRSAPQASAEAQTRWERGLCSNQPAPDVTPFRRPIDPWSVYLPLKSDSSLAELTGGRSKL